MSIKLDEAPVTVHCHPLKNVGAVGCLDGTVHLFSYSCTEEPSGSSVDDQNLIQCSFKHKAPLRKVRFSSSGNRLYSLTRNKALTIRDVETGVKLKLIRKLTLKEEKAGRPYSMLVVSEHQIAIGDECGILRIIDFRSKNNPPIAAEIAEESTNQHLSDMICDQSGRTLLATCGDCSLMTYDLRKNKCVVKSEPMHDELNCLTWMKRDKKVFCGSNDGFMDVFNFGEFGDIVERYETGHKDTVDCLTKLDEDLLVTGSSDGCLRLHHTVPNKFLQVIGSHEEKAPIEELAICPKLGMDEFLISCGHDNAVRFWNVANLKRRAPRTKSGSEIKRIIKKNNYGDTFFEDLQDQPDSDSDDDDEDDEDISDSSDDRDTD